MKLSQISLALINPRLELVNEIQRCNQGPCQNYAKEQWVTPIEALISQVADLIKLNLNFEFLNSFPLLRGWGGGGTERKIYYLTPPVLSCRLFSHPLYQFSKRTFHCIPWVPAVFPRVRRGVSSATGRHVFGDLTDLTESRDRA